MNGVRKAVFPVAGLGSRFLPATKAMPKELLPIVDKPLIQYAVEEAILAGIDTLIFITGRNKRAIEDHFDRNLELEHQLISRGKVKEAEEIKNIIPKNVECIFVRQAEQLGLGHAILCSERVVGSEPFAILLADDFLLSKKKNVTEELIKAHGVRGQSQLSTIKVTKKEVSNYGVLKFDKNKKTVIGLVEKPNTNDAPSLYASIGRYVVSPKIFNILRSITPGKSNELQLADALNVLAEQGQLESNIYTGTRFDCGSVSGYVEAIKHLSSNKRVRNS